MLVKIAKAPYFEGSNNNSFMIFDNVTEIEEYTTQPIEYTSSKNLEQFMYGAPHYMGETRILNEERIDDFASNPYAMCGKPIEEELSEKKVYRINSLTFKRGDKSQLIYFDTIAYICNDKGETLEKCFAGGVLNRN